MARRSTGQVVEWQTKRGLVYALRFYAAGERRYQTLGTDAEGSNRRKAEDELAAVMAAVRVGTWTPRVSTQAPIEEADDPTLHSSRVCDWRIWRASCGRERSRTTAGVSSITLLPFFAEYRVAAISVQDVDRYKAAKLRLAAAQINKTIKRLAQIIDGANPARGRRRRVKEPKPRRTWIEPEQLLALLDAAPRGHRPILATLAGAGLRVGEAVALDWRDVNLATGVLTVRESRQMPGRVARSTWPAGSSTSSSRTRLRASTSAQPIRCL
jgi:integrase